MCLFCLFIAGSNDDDDDDDGHDDEDDDFRLAYLQVQPESVPPSLSSDPELYSNKEKKTYKTKNNKPS